MLGRAAWKPGDAEHAAALAALDQEDPSAQAWLPIPRVSEAPEEPAPEPRRGPKCPDKVRRAIPDVLARAEQDARQWSWVSTLLGGRDGSRLDLTAPACWAELAKEDQARILSGASRYLAAAEPTPEQLEAMHTTPGFAGVLYAGYQALALLAQVLPARLEELTPALWERWAPVVLLIFWHEGDAEREV